MSRSSCASAFLGLGLLATPAPAHACGPFLARALVLEPAEAVWAAPVADFSEELRALTPAGDLPYEPGYVTTVDTELETLTPLGVDADAWRAWRRGEPVARPALPDSVSKEFILYANGGMYWKKGDRAAAIAQWKALLALPADQRPTRTLWATFMLAEASQTDAAFDRVLALVDAGAPDPLGLAFTTLGEKARLKLWAKDWRGAVDGYLHQGGFRTAESTNSLRMVVEQAIDEGALPLWAPDPVLRPLATAYILAHGGDVFGGGDQALVQTWLQVLTAAHAETVEEADHLAWLSYQAGDVPSTAAWLDRSAPTPLAHWLRAKLLMRAGKLPEAEAELREAARGFPPDLRWEDGSVATGESWVGIVPAQAAWGEAGVVRLARKDWRGALDAFLASGSWVDAAYVAERILDVGALRTAVTPLPALPLDHTLLDTGGWARVWPADAVDPDHPQPSTSAAALRYLLGRRLLRAGTLADIGDFPPEVAENARLYTEALDQGHHAWTAEGRAEGLWKAAYLARTRGLSMMGTELEPDYSIYAGDFQDYTRRDARFEAIGQPLGPTKEEEALWRASAPNPDRRWHYRTTASELAEQAAAELPDDDPRVGMLLCRATRWNLNSDPAAAQRYIQEALHRTGAWPSEPCGEAEFWAARVMAKRIAGGLFFFGLAGFALRRVWRRRRA